jgi:hypothetical protein
LRATEARYHRSPIGESVTTGCGASRHRLWRGDQSAPAAQFQALAGIALKNEALARLQERAITMAIYWAPGTQMRFVKAPKLCRGTIASAPSGIGIGVTTLHKCDLYIAAKSCRSACFSRTSVPCWKRTPAFNRPKPAFDPFPTIPTFRDLVSFTPHTAFRTGFAKPGTAPVC